MVIRQRFFVLRAFLGDELEAPFKSRGVFEKRQEMHSIFFHRLEALPLHYCLILWGKPCQNAAGNGGNASNSMHAIILKKNRYIKGEKRWFVSNVLIGVRVYRFFDQRILEIAVKIICDVVCFIA